MGQTNIATFSGDSFASVLGVISPKISTIIVEIIVERVAARLAEDFMISENSNVEIVLPEYKAKPPKNYNYLSRQGLDILKRTIRDRFIIELWTDLHRHGYIGRRRDELIYAWMEAHGIEITDTNWNSIAKIYIRQYKNYLQREAYKRKSKKS